MDFHKSAHYRISRKLVQWELCWYMQTGWWTWWR